MCHFNKLLNIAGVITWDKIILVHAASRPAWMCLRVTGITSNGIVPMYISAFQQ